MTAAEHRAEAASSTNSSRTGVTALTVAAWASVGAGAIHAAAIGIHAEHRQAALVFTAIAVFQVGWGTVALAMRNRLVAMIGGMVNAGLVGGWVMAQTSGIGFVDGLDAAHPAELPDSLAAALAAVAALLCAAAASARRDQTFWRPVGRITSVVGVVAVVGLTLPGLVGASNVHDHGSGDGVTGHDDHDGNHEPGGASDESAAGDGHDHGSAAPSSEPAPKPYDPTMPIDLGGVEGVTPQQQAAAENLIAVTLLRLPQFAEPAAAEAAGFHSIRDGFTGHEHYINWSYIDDGRFLDPDYPESLVYETGNDGEKELVAAMYMLGSDDTLDDVPELGGDLTQWHIHNDLCFTDDPVAPVVAGLVNADGGCDPPLVKLAQAPMIHVWIVPHECGPFAALDGIAGGQIAEGEERLCDHAHGGV